MVVKNLFKICFLSVVVLLSSCSKEDDSVDNPDNATGNSTAVYLTDAPVDDANVEAVFITVSEVKVNGKAVDNFEKTTLEISSLTNGKTELLGQLNLDAGMTNDITLVLSGSDASGNSLGNYVVLNGGSKEEIAGDMEINLNDNAAVIQDTENEIVLDFDLRKSLKANNGDYSLVSESKLENNISAVNTLNAGAVKGQVDNTSEANGDVVVAYAYKKGEFNSSEKDANGDGIRFSNAASSAVVSESSGNFEIHFLEEGDYELHFASYSDSDSDGNLEFKGMVSASTASSLDLSGFTVTAGSEVNLEISFTGLLGL
ncbi:hypothetical protein C7S20_02775 [Christiangramia fulva]|uniref:DUF4382 domain-containing protein n=1 Tax=Christiangramia fulva TaxID=2126553 RepID=A0A2R3Z1W7_9FLAO|nr:DUF4382 domain-containing protein [Christiangramia fulva]AVR44270.1 hypothetical protein C7S20_02775 [Christiangramia fulva]